MSKHLKQLPLVQMSTLPEPTGGGLITTDFTVSYGQPISPQQRILLYSSDEWENFILEWVHYQKTIYSQVLRQTGSGDMGIDVAGYTDEQGVFGVWDNFQCKHYANPLSVADACKEIAKILWYSFKEEYSPPRAYYFMAPKGCSTALSHALKSPQKLKEELKDRWPRTCAEAITTTQSIDLVGKFADYVENFDFSIFGQRTTLEIIDGYRHTPFYATRFGGGLPKRPSIPDPPNTPAQTESRYIEQLFEAYSDHKSCSLSTTSCLSLWPNLANHLQRQRECFYYAESLRNFARDSVPVGTFEELQGEVHAGVVDVAELSHTDSFDRVNAVTSAAINMHLTANPLIQVAKAQDRKGICHQLANEDRLIWKKT